MDTGSSVSARVGAAELTGHPRVIDTYLGLSSAAR
jgi:hypothetical protein